MVKKTLQELGNERHYLTPYKRTYSKLKNSAKIKNIPVDLTYEEFVKFTKQKECHYCLDTIIWVAHGKLNNSRYNLDRIDNTKGYSVDNCVVSCWRCNNSRSNRFTYDDWYGMTSYLRIAKTHE